LTICPAQAVCYGAESAAPGKAVSRLFSVNRQGVNDDRRNPLDFVSWNRHLPAKQTFRSLLLRVFRAVMVIALRRHAGSIGSKTIS
jgi:hypothetical protein